MGEVPLSLHLNAETSERLEREARLRDISPSEVAKQAVEAFLDAQAFKHEAIVAAVEEAEKGIFISEEAMLEWMDRLDLDPDVAPPEPDIFLPPRA